MFSDLFINTCIIVSLIFLVSRFFNQYHPISPDSPLGVKLVLSVLCGVLGIVLMKFSIHVNPTTIVDLRHIGIILIAAYCGFFPSVIAGLIVAIGRLLLLDVTHNAMEASMVMFILGMGCGILFNFTTRWSVLQRLILMNTFCMTAISFLIVHMLNHDIEFNLSTFCYKILPIHWFFSFVAMYFSYYTMEYIRARNSIFKKLEKDSATDFLTSLNNQRQFETLFNAYMFKAKQQQKNLTLLLLDIDHFKKINDRYGHEAGDAVLKEIGVILQKATRLGDIVSRNGGEEFSIILPDQTKSQAQNIAERIRKTMEEHYFLLPTGLSIQITVSIGIATYPETCETKDLFKKADESLYKAKSLGRNLVVVQDSL
ncbi:diguanylate cyclase [Ammoniphilus sp. YIM 78166]|uniref:diguanylate cyclase n=1 Tax=Ammoniphilus sp. YIM 78166 TaxID=1644106 RepID=UPI001070344D|nr:diguanylate cyclase [Ammoniphilus sp. YIM 78166]